MFRHCSKLFIRECRNPLAGNYSGASNSTRDRIIGKVGNNMMISEAEYELRVRELEAEGLTRSDAQGVVDAEVISEQAAQKEKDDQQ